MVYPCVGVEELAMVYSHVLGWRSWLWYIAMCWVEELAMVAMCWVEELAMVPMC